MIDQKALVSRIFDGKDGKEFDKLLRRICGVDSLTVMNPDPYLTYFNEGKRFVYNYLEKMKEGKLDGNRQSTVARTDDNNGD